MDARPLRDVLADLAGDAGARAAYGADPAGYLAAHGHPDLPEPLVAEAVVSYADTAPVEVAEALAPYVAAHGPVPDESPAPDWFDLLTSAEAPVDEPPPDPDWPDPEELDFGAGAGDLAEPPPTVAEEEPDVETAPIADTTPEPDWSPAEFTPEPPIEGLAPEEDPDAEDLLD